MSAAAPEPVPTAPTSRDSASQEAADDDARAPIRMLADRLLARPAGEAGERKNRAGILIPATANVERRLVWATIVAVGPTVRAISEGDRVLYAPDTGYDVEIRGDDYIILREREIHAVASERIEDRTGLYL